MKRGFYLPSCALTFALFAPMVQVNAQTGGSGMGGSGATGGVAGASAAAGAQGASSSGAASGGGPNTSPVIPSGAQATDAPSNSMNGTSRGAFNSYSGVVNNGSMGNVPTGNRMQNTRQRFGNSDSSRATVQNGSPMSQFPPQPNRTYRSDLGGWETIGPYPPGATVNPSTSTVTGVNGQQSGASVNGGYPTFQGNIPMTSVSPYLAPGIVLQNIPDVVGSVPPPRGIGFANSLSPSSQSLPPAGATALGANRVTSASPADFAMAAQARPRLGISLSPNFTGSGARISNVLAMGPAAHAGLRSGDVITSLNGQGIYSYQDVLATAETMQPETIVEVIAWRNGQSLPLSINLSAMETRDAGFDPSRTSSSVGEDMNRLARMETLMHELRSEVQQLKARE